MSSEGERFPRPFIAAFGLMQRSAAWYRATDATPITTTRSRPLTVHTNSRELVKKTTTTRTLQRSEDARIKRERERERECSKRLFVPFLSSSFVNERSSRSPSGSRLLLRHRRARMRAKDSSFALILDQIWPIDGARSRRESN